MNTVGLMAWLIVASFGTVLLFATWMFYGKLIMLQTKIWFLAKRGFHLVEHVGTNKVRSYFYLRPKDNKFDFKSGFYIHYPETTTKTDNLVKPVPKDLNSGFKFRKVSDMAENAEEDKAYKELEEKISKLVYDVEAVTLRWGIPIITYVGNSPYPVNFAEPDKEYGVQVIRDVYIRLLATEQYGFMRKIITIGLILFGVIAVALIAIYFVTKTNAGNLGVCLNTFNSTITQLVDCTAKQSLVSAANGVVVV